MTSAELSAKADRHLWGHFARHGAGITPPIITRGEGVRIWDSHSRSYIDGLSGLFTVTAEDSSAGATPRR